MHFLESVNHKLPAHKTTQLFKYRYQVFVELLGWQLDVPPGRETDQFDHDDTLYVIAEDEAGSIVGCARLLPTTAPYLLEEVFPELLNGAPIPKSADIWELSRFTSCDLNSVSNTRSGQFSSEDTVDLLEASLDCARRHGAKRVISVSPIGVERLLRRAGFKARRAGPPTIVDGYPLVACWIDL